MCEFGITVEVPDFRTLFDEMPGMAPVDGWQSVAKGLRSHVSKLSRAVQNDNMSAIEWRNRFDSVVRLGHINAHAAGQKIAGMQPFGVEAARAGNIAADLESEFIEGFFNDLKDGAYLDKDGVFRENKFISRMMMYVQKTRGTAYDGYVYGSPGATFDWKIGAAEQSCEECPVWAQGGPYTEDTLAILPGGGDTTCRTNCKCYLVRHDGVVGPMPFGVNV